MNRHLRYLACFLPVIVVMFPSNSSLLACDCNPPEPEEALVNSDAGFRGTVEAVEEVDSRLVVRLFISTVWKGATDEFIHVITSSSEASCGVPFMVGDDYLVFANDWGSEVPGLGELHDATDCNGTRLYADEFAVRLPKPIWQRDTGAPFRRGDCNDDGEVDLSDAVCTLNWLFLGGPTPGCLAVADVNGEDGINIADPTYLLNFLFLGGLPPAPPFPDCGTSDLESDTALGCLTLPEHCR